MKSGVQYEPPGLNKTGRETQTQQYELASKRDKKKVALDLLSLKLKSTHIHLKGVERIS